MDDDDDSPIGTHNDWVQHPYTRKVIKALHKQQQNLLIELLGACERSADSCVAAAHARYRMNAEQLSLYSPRAS